MTTWITICDSCKRDGWDDTGTTQTDGEVLAELVEGAADGVANVRTRRHSCLMGCARACNITVQGAGKLNYSLGTFEPSAEAAQAIVDYAALHADSDTGQVPYKLWPQPIKGHFVSRHLPLPDDG